MVYRFFLHMTIFPAYVFKILGNPFSTFPPTWIPFVEKGSFKNMQWSLEVSFYMVFGGFQVGKVCLILVTKQFIRFWNNVCETLHDCEFSRKIIVKINMNFLYVNPVIVCGT